MELLFLFILIALMAFALGSGYPVAFALPGSAILSIMLAAICGYLFADNVDAYFHQGGPAQWLSAGVTNLRGVYWEPERDTLIAIPLFIFMGIMLQRSKIAEDLLITMAQLFGPVPGGLGISVIFVGALLAATTGIVGATVVAMGLISLPAMLRNNYSQPLATGTIAASGTLGQIIPPSIVLIILADQLASSADQAGSIRKDLFKDATGEISMPSAFDITSTSAGEMFLGAFVPGLLLVALYMLYTLVFALIRPKSAPTVPREGALDRKFLGNVLLTLIPPLALIFLVLGSIITGVATVNQAGAIGAAGALVMAGYRLKETGKSTYVPALLAIVSIVTIFFITGNFDTNIKNINSTNDAIGVSMAVIAVAVLIIALIWSGWRAYKIDDTLTGVMVETAKATSLVFIILLGAAMLTAAFRAFGGEDIVREFLNGLPGGFWTKFVIVMAVIFVLGFFLDFIEIAVVVVPIVAPILLADPSANITAVWLGVMIGLNIQTSFLTPPFGFALFYLRGVAPAAVKTISIYKGVIPFIALQLIALAIVGVTPQLVNYLPNRVSLLSETAPPPRNPKLQYCLEEYALDKFDNNGAEITGALDRASGLDLAVLPEDVQDDWQGAISEAREAIDLLNRAREADRVVQENAADYRPVHSLVRGIEANITKLEEEIADLDLNARRFRGEEQAETRAQYEMRIADREAEIEELRKGIPDTWEATHDAFAELTQAEDRLRLQYRRAADSSYQAIAEITALLQDSSALAEMDGTLREMRSLVETGDPAELIEPLNALADEFDAIEGAGSIQSSLSSARRDLDDDEPNRDDALDEIDEAIAELRDQMAWRNRVSDELVSEAAAIEETLRDTLGVRSQERMSEEQALFVASCSAGHRDISLNF